MNLDHSSMISPHAFVDPSAVVGVGSTIWHFAVVLAGVKIGSDCSIGSKAEIGRRSVIGSGTRISSGVFLPSKSRVGSQVFIGPNATFTDDRHPRAGNADYIAEPPILEDECSIGAGAVILPGVRIGARAMIAAGAIVAKDVAPGTTVRCERAREHLDTMKALRREAVQGYDAGVR